eukprot:TRINITY_DN693_c0_g1_i7.p1 TRINITY_DN693_c0_g1~~TRINITY_DN693_c0_g1_i7.p1  ORF type:complete len:299 (-),score=65.23 TRINITY_DN693_c0_g1_i7:165-1061(-)
MSCFFVLSLCLAVHDAFGAVVVTSDAAALLPENGAKVAGGARALAGAESRPLMRSAAATGALMARRERNTSDGEAAPAPSAEPAATTGSNATGNDQPTKEELEANKEENGGDVSAAGDAQPAGPTGDAKMDEENKTGNVASTSAAGDAQPAGPTGDAKMDEENKTGNAASTSVFDDLAGEGSCVEVQCLPEMFEKANSAIISCEGPCTKEDCCSAKQVNVTDAAHVPQIEDVSVTEAPFGWVPDQGARDEAPKKPEIDWPTTPELPKLEPGTTEGDRPFPMSTFPPTSRREKMLSQKG